VKEIVDDEKTLLSGLRAQIHAWFKEIMPEIRGLRDPNLPIAESQDFAMRRRYAELLARDRWAGLAWDTRWGGQGAAFAERHVFADEAAQFDAPDPLSRLGVDIIGPTINVLGTEEQKAMFLPDILAATVIWCQGFSEPNAGSDLASLRTKASQSKDGSWTITGQKVWTSFGQYADICVVLARTDPDAPKHKGISAFAVPLSLPGITIKPIAQITGGHDFCEVFYDDVVVDATALLGKPGQGWLFAMTALGFERSINFMTRQVRLTKQVADLIDQIRQHSDRIPERLKDHAVSIHIRSTALQATIGHHMASLDRGEEPGPDNNASKIYWSESYQQLADLGCELEQTVTGFRDVQLADWSQAYLAARATSIYAGTSEIQRNIIAERGLGLPK
jgi:alkylation response protein AidB-like acyl-CoA dehydrogenase